MNRLKILLTDLKGRRKIREKAIQAFTQAYLLADLTPLENELPETAGILGEVNSVLEQAAEKKDSFKSVISDQEKELVRLNDENKELLSEISALKETVNFLTDQQNNRTANDFSATEDKESLSKLENELVEVRRQLESEQQTKADLQAEIRKTRDLADKDGASNYPETAVADNFPAIVNEIIKLMDWLQIASETGEAASPALLGATNKKLERVLKKAGVTILDENGIFNENHQCAVDTRITDNAEQNNLVCDTVRPGYIFNDELIRQQEVVVFVYRG